MRHDPDLGQTSTSYLGMVALAAALVAAVLALGVPASFADGVQRAICTITSATDCGSPVGGGEVAEPTPTPLEVATSGRFVAIGDSFTSGEGAYDYEDGSDRDGECHRSTHAYPHELAGDLDFADGSSFVACSGAKTRNVLERGQNGEPAQIDAVDESASLVTIGIGGNDAKWGDAVWDCAVSNCLDAGPDLDRRIEEASEAAAEVFREVRHRVDEDARVLAVGYPLFFPESPERGQYDIGVVSISRAEQALLNEKTRKLNRLLASHAAEAGVEFVDVSAAFVGHEFGSDDSYFNGLKVGLPEDYSLDVFGTAASGLKSETFHPNAQGQKAMAEVIRRQVVAPVQP